MASQESLVDLPSWKEDNLFDEKEYRQSDLRSDMVTGSNSQFSNGITH